MNTPNEEVENTENVENVGAEATCAPGCDCNAGGGGRARWIAGIVILVVAGVLVARAMVKDRDTEDPQDESTFALAAPSAGAESQPGVADQFVKHASPSKAAPADQPQADDKAVATVAGKEISSLDELNKLAADTTAVFVYLPGKDADSAQEAPTSLLEGAVGKIKAQGINVGIFTLKTDAPEYAQLAAQMTVPGVVTMSKGGGMVPVTGEITEAKLIQGFVAASSAGGCGPSAASGCCP
jgi:hypothetical protein